MYLAHPYRKATIPRKMRGEGKEVRTVPRRSLAQWLGVITPVTLQRISQRLSQLGSRSGYSYGGSCFYSTYPPRSRLLHPSYWDNVGICRLQRKPWWTSHDCPSIVAQCKSAVRLVLWHQKVVIPLTVHFLMTGLHLGTAISLKDIYYNSVWGHHHYNRYELFYS